MSKAVKRWDATDLINEAKHDLGVAYIKEQTQKEYHWKDAIRTAVKDCGDHFTKMSKKHRFKPYYLSACLVRMTERVTLWRFYRICKIANLKVCVVNKDGHMFTIKHPGYLRGGIRIDNNAVPGDAEIFQ